MNLVLNSAGQHVSYETRKIGILEATEQGMDVFTHFAQYFGCNGMPQLGRNYRSPFPLDKNYRPSFRLYISPKSGHVIYEDFAAAKGGNCFDFVMHLLGHSYAEAFEYIEKTILHGITPTVFPSQLTLSGRTRVMREKPPLVIEPWLRDWDSTGTDVERYAQVGITDEGKQFYNIFPLGGARISGGEDRNGFALSAYHINHTAENPLYGYYYPLSGKWKLNRPKHPNPGKRWGPNNTQGEAELFGQHLFPLNIGAERMPVGLIGAGQRDTVAMFELFTLAGVHIPCTCFSSESANCSPAQFSLLDANCVQWWTLTDNDKAGLASAKKLNEIWSMPSLNETVHSLGSNDLCAWLNTPLGQQPEARLELAQLLISIMTA